MEQRTRTITINNARSEAPHHQRKNQELRAKNTFGNNEYRTNTIKHQNNITCVLIVRRVFYLLFCSLTLCFFLVFDIVLCSCCWCCVLCSCSLFLLLCLVCLCSLSLILSLVRKNQMKTTSTNVEQRTRTIIIKNDTNETPHHQRKNQEIKAKNTFGNNGYRTNNIKTRTTLNVF